VLGAGEKVRDGDLWGFGDETNPHRCRSGRFAEFEAVYCVAGLVAAGNGRGIWIATWGKIPLVDIAMGGNVAVMGRVPAQRLVVVS
jgi:hypothetical protein